ncbi:MAG TPA: hypothetical protein VMR98_02590 [Candidatus Polarisedimenticolaceae bacterium]|nr:hypothetical protein [Candidatus Polarisedimenticolaceae bacterium]
MHRVRPFAVRHWRGIFAGSVAFLAVVLAGGWVAVSSAEAQRVAPPGTSAGICSANVVLHLSKGVSFAKKIPESQKGDNTSIDPLTGVLETGRFSCLPGATIDGYKVAGPGTIGFKAKYWGSCFKAPGGGTWSFHIPVYDQGGVRMLARSGAYTGPAIGLAIKFSGAFQGGHLGGVGLVIPMVGNCLPRHPMLTARFLAVETLALGQ